MTESKCDLCGAVITGPVSKMGILVRDPGAARRRTSAQSFLEALGQGGGPGDVREYDGCFECAASLMVELERRRKQVKELGRVVSQ